MSGLQVIPCLLAAAIASAQPVVVAPAAQGGVPGALETLDLEQLMQIEVVVAASKRAQSVREVPSFVTVVTAAEIKAHGYRTLTDVVQTLASFYTSNDRNYSFIGVRGFERSGDYNSRILLLVNGLRANDNVYDAAAVGEEFIVDIDLVERIEIVRGPSAAIYGSNAFFAVINVVTRDGASLQGGEVAASAASYGTFAGRATYGRALANGLDFLVSASLSDSSGQTLYFPEYDDPETNNGVAQPAASAESFRKLLGTASKGNFTFHFSNVSREKHVPTGVYDTLFNDPRSVTVDGLTLAGLTYDRTLASGATISARLHGGHWSYEAAYAAFPLVEPGRDEGFGEWWGVDVDGARRYGRHFLTVGTEFRDNYRQDQKTYELDPFVVYTDTQNASRRWGAFAQDDMKLLERLTLHAGLRYDHYESFGSVMSPRLGLIYNPDAATTLKLLAGRAFRAPNEFELHYGGTLYAANPDLEPERIETLEILGQRFIGSGVELTAGVFRNHLTDLISQVVLDDERLIFANAEAILSRGVEVGLQVNRGRGTTGRLTYSFQDTVDRATGAGLTNSPRHMAKLQLVTPFAGRFSAALDTRLVSGRRTILGNTAPAYALANLSLLAPRLFGRLDLNATLYNVFDVDYGVPGHEEVRQDILLQDGRSFRVKTTLRF